MSSSSLVPCEVGSLTGQVLGHLQRVDQVAQGASAAAHAAHVVEEYVVAQRVEVLGHFGERHLLDAVELEVPLVPSLVGVHTRSRQRVGVDVREPTPCDMIMAGASPSTS